MMSREVPSECWTPSLCAINAFACGCPAWKTGWWQQSEERKQERVTLKEYPTDSTFIVDGRVEFLIGGFGWRLVSTLQTMKLVPALYNELLDGLLKRALENPDALGCHLITYDED